MKGIYLITVESPETIYRYVGQSKNIAKRKHDHLRKLSLDRHANQKLQNVYTKYGKENLSFRILIECEDSVTAEELTELETSLCELFQSYAWDSPSGCNLVYPDKTMEPGSLVREKMSIATKRQHEDPEYKEKLREAVRRATTNRWNLMSEEERQDFKKKMKDRWQNPEYREKLLNAKKQYNANPTNAKAISKKNSKAAQTRWADPEFIALNHKTLKIGGPVREILAIDPNGNHMTFRSQHHCSREIGISQSILSGYLRKKDSLPERFHDWSFSYVTY